MSTGRKKTAYREEHTHYIQWTIAQISSTQLKRYAGNTAGICIHEIVQTTQDLRIQPIQQLEINIFKIYVRQNDNTARA